MEREPKFEALVYTGNAALAARCARAFAEFPVDWIMLYESSLALDYLSKERFDYVILDLDSVENCSILIEAVKSGVNLKSVVLAITSASVDPSVLELCYASRVFYPIRPVDIQEHLYRAVPLAERLAEERRQIIAVACPDADAEEPSANFWRRSLANLIRSIFGMKHSLSIVTQERVASLLASVGIMWFVQEVTEDFHGIELIQPPSAGPGYLIALALLLWLCAKQRRISNPRAQACLSEA